jgi:putative transposase
MPEHQHLIVRGTRAESDVRQTVTEYKQRTGFWLAQKRIGIKWHKNFYDHIIRADEDLGAQIRYVAENPVRRGLVEDWREYPYTGTIGADLQTVMADVATL